MVGWLGEQVEFVHLCGCAGKTVRKKSLPSPFLTRLCNLTKREQYVESTGEVIDGILYRWLRTRCLDCGQYRVDGISGAIAGSIKPSGF